MYHAFILENGDWRYAGNSRNRSELELWCQGQHFEIIGW
jgi:hypothetical protein